MIPQEVVKQTQALIDAALTDDPTVKVATLETKRAGTFEPVYLLCVTVEDETGGVSVIPMAEMLPPGLKLEERYIDPKVAAEMDEAKDG